MPPLALEQALYGSLNSGGYRFLARSPGFLDDWLPEAERLCTRFGERPAGVACPACVFAQPFGKRHVAVIQAADQGTDDTGRPGALAFHLLVLRATDYRLLGGDPFLIAERFPPSWQNRGELPTLYWPEEPLPPRTVRQVRQVLKRPDGPTFLGASQVLIDGGRLVFERSHPDTELLRDLWLLLPVSTRSELWPASFAFGNTLRFHAVVVPRAVGDEYADYVSEEQAGDYPSGRYEFHLQAAAEAGDQDELNALFARRSRTETFRLGLMILAFLVMVTPLVHLLVPSPPPEPPKPAVKPTAAPPPEVHASSKLDLAERYPEPTVREWQKLNEQLIHLGERLDYQPLHSVLARPELPRALGAVVAAASSGPLTAAGLLVGPQLSPGVVTEVVLEALDHRLGTPDARRDPGALRKLGSPQRQLRALLWKQGVDGYNDAGLNPFELRERLEQKVTARE